jgi:trans-aconitate methyltransferase
MARMAVSEIRFDDGASYERYMGTWSRLVGDIFLTWLAPSSGLRWIDIGCGNGAFTEQIVERCAPAEWQNMERLKARVHARLTADAAGRITYAARANAIKGRKS